MFHAIVVGQQGLAYCMTVGLKKMSGTSIHPSGKRGNNVGVNGPICAPRNPNKKGKLAKASSELDRRRRTHAGQKHTTAGFRQPGSMKT